METYFKIYFQFIKKNIFIPFKFSKLYKKGNQAPTLNPFSNTSEIQSSRTKIDFNNLKSTRIILYEWSKNWERYWLKDEISFEDNLYKAPDINFLSKPEIGREYCKSKELDLIWEVKGVLTDFKIEGEIIRVSPVNCNNV